MRKLLFFLTYVLDIQQKSTKPRKHYRILSLKINMLVSANACKGQGCHRSTRLKSRMLRESASTTSDQVRCLWLVVSVRVTHPMWLISHFCHGVCVQLLLPLEGGIHDVFVFDIQRSKPEPGAGDWDHFWNIFDWQGGGEREGQGRASHASNYRQMASPVSDSIRGPARKARKGVNEYPYHPVLDELSLEGEMRYAQIF